MRRGGEARAVRLGLVGAAALVALAVPPPTRGDSEAGSAAEAGTRSAVERLEKLAAESDPGRNPILNSERADRLRSRLAAAETPPESRRLRFMLAYELLLAGKTRDAVSELDELAAAYEAYGPRAARPLRLVREVRALAYLRQGEQENCQGHHTAESCLMPIRGAGVHGRPRGSRLALEEYGTLLEGDPENNAYRWLYNLAAMTLGEYPDEVPPIWRIPPSAFASEYDILRFPDVAAEVGLKHFGLAGGAVMEDFDGDGRLDLMVSSWDLRGQLRFYRRNPDGTYSDRTVEAGLVGQTGGLNLVHGDYDNDGWPDVLVLRGAWLGMVGEGLHPNSLLRNDGDGSFTDVTEEAGLLSFHPTQTAAWGDYDGDGWLDLFVGNETTPGSHHPCELFHNEGDGTFRQVAAEAGIEDVGFVKGVAWGDYDNDGRIDLYLSRLGEPNVLYRNQGPDEGPEGSRGPRFRDTTVIAGVEEPRASFATWFWDYDNDGWEDLFVAPFVGFDGRNLGAIAADYLGHSTDAETPRLFRNRRDGTFEDVTTPARLRRPTLAMGANFGDLDNDGFLDLYLATGEPDLGTLIPNRMYRNDRGREFQDVTTSGGFGHLQKGHGVAFGDLDEDGDQDVFVVLGGAYEGDPYWSALFENPGHGHHWITLRLEGTRSNRSAIGARIRVRLRGPAGERDVYVNVGAGGSFGGSSLQQEIGLGDAEEIREIEIRWPGGGTQTFADLRRDAVYRIREGSREAVLVAPRDH